MKKQEIVAQFIRLCLEKNKKRPLVIGINGPQVNSLSSYFPSLLYFSMDDLYIPYSQQQTQTHPLLKQRGLPGTIDWKLGVQVISDLIDGKATRIPKYEKSLHSGKGDRLPIDQWPVAQKPQIILLEGWCLGFQAVDSPPPELALVNDHLKEFNQLYSYLDYFVQLKTRDIEIVYEWRWEQEEMMINEKGSGMDKSQVKDFVDRFMPCYRLYYGKDFMEGKRLVLVVDKNRDVVEYKQEL
ncbi:hypothetical protein HK103_007076 [Boothiomyces macroporosus]|uniref:Uridine kinase n=1 Tax=Boothiomyces macroporosus TaxID=261099 RepID=A0AAD5UDK8_9FUNG|nr:hypothetical protein HK103_007076 [Boothiomyces macroporosus]